MRPGSDQYAEHPEYSAPQEDRLLDAGPGDIAGQSGPAPESSGRRPRDGRRRKQSPAGRRRTPLEAAVAALTEVVVVLGMALILSLLIKTFLFQAFFIPSQSMEDTLLVGDRVVVSKISVGPGEVHRGDIVVFSDPGGWLSQTDEPEASGLSGAARRALTWVGLLPQNSGDHLIKRVIGMPGDTVKCCDAQGRLLVNGVPLDETYVYPGDRPSELDFAVTVPAGHLWMMGDHRSVSKDSRYNPQQQFVPQSAVVGKAFAVVWPFDRMSGLGNPSGTFGVVPATPAEPLPSNSGAAEPSEASVETTP